MYLDQTKLKLLIKQRDTILAWVEEQGTAAAEQRQLEANSAERLYWHYGYQSALTDLINFVAFSDSQGSTAGTPN